MNSTEAASQARPAYKRKVRNYLLDVGLQLRYTATIVIVAVFLTAGLGFKMYQATRDVSKVILWTSLVDPSSAEELQAQFSNSDRVVLWGIVGFGLVLVLSISAVGILITHKVAGPLHKIASIFARVRDNRLGPTLSNLRKGDELQEFYSAFREMHSALRERVEEDIRMLGNAVSALETAPDARSSPALARSLEDLRQLRKRKEDSLEPSPDSGLIDLTKGRT
jgi:methyl-accepting chemotaxis protein